MLKIMLYLLRWYIEKREKKIMGIKYKMKEKRMEGSAKKRKLWKKMILNHVIVTRKWSTKSTERKRNYWVEKE